MFYSDTDYIRLKINEFGALRKPFLFGLNFEMTEGFFFENPLSQKEIYFQIGDVGNKDCTIKNIDKAIRFESLPISYNQYCAKFDIISKGLKRGDSFLTNLTVKTPINTNIGLEDIFNLSKTAYQLYLPDRFVCFSPERFVKIEKGIISSNPMKGTIDAAIPDAEQLILSDFKETAEHATIVDLIRNDLSQVAINVRVKRSRYIDKIVSNNKSIFQVSSEIEGILPHDYRSYLGDILFSMLPAGSISGAPKNATINLIKTAENEPRGYYTGIFGYFDGERLETGVLIRFIEQNEGQFYFRSGGGITAYSKCEDEYQEVLNKIYLPFV